MNKYNQMYGDGSTDARSLLSAGEEVLWQGKPKKNAYIINSCTKMLPIALIWLTFDGFFIASFFASGAMSDGGPMILFLIVFFGFHLMPVWIWLFNAVSANKRWRNTEYMVTSRRILIRNGFIGYSFENIFYTDISDVKLHIGVIDKMLGVGDIMISTKVGKGAAILDISEAQMVFNELQKIIMDIQTDIHYPNALRPEENPGYQTGYRR